MYPVRTLEPIVETQSLPPTVCFCPTAVLGRVGRLLWMCTPEPHPEPPCPLRCNRSPRDPGLESFPTRRPFYLPVSSSSISKQRHMPRLSPGVHVRFYSVHVPPTFRRVSGGRPFLGMTGPVDLCHIGRLGRRGLRDVGV